MDTKNVIAAISLSAAVIILYSLFFAPSPEEIRKNSKNTNQIEKNSETPTLEDNKELAAISREDAINENERVEFENNDIKGSISLIGGSIDDLIFKNYTSTLNGNDNIVLLNPRKISDGYYVETGWVTNNKNIDLPNSKTVWEIDGNKKLTPILPNNPTLILTTTNNPKP